MKTVKTGEATELPRPPERYADCNVYYAELGKCKALNEMLCITRGRCKFYRAKKNETEQKGV